MALQLALIEKVNTDGPDVFLISTKGLGDVRNRAVAVLFDMAQDLICKPLPNSWQLLFLVVNAVGKWGSDVVNKVTFTMPTMQGCIDAGQRWTAEPDIGFRKGWRKFQCFDRY